MVNPLSYLSFSPMLHNWCNKGRTVYYPVCRLLHIKYLLLLIGKSSLLCDCRGFTISLTTSLTPYNRKKCVECVVKLKKLQFLTNKP